MSHLSNIQSCDLQEMQNPVILETHKTASILFTTNDFRNLAIWYNLLFVHRKVYISYCIFITRRLHISQENFIFCYNCCLHQGTKKELIMKSNRLILTCMSVFYLEVRKLFHIAIYHLDYIIWLSEQFQLYQQSSLQANYYPAKKTNFMAPFYGWVSTATRLEPFRGGSLIFTTSPQKFLVLTLLTLEK